MTERVAEVGYINDEHRHVLITIHEPTLLNARSDSVQVAITIESAIELRANLSAFLEQHEVTRQ